MTAPLAGCTSSLAPGNRGPSASTTIVKVPPDRPQNVEYQDQVTESTSEDIGVHDVRFRYAGQKGVLVAGDAVNQSDRTFEEFVTEVTLYDEDDTQGGLLDSVEEQTSTDSVGAGEAWQWAVTFSDEPLPEIDYYAVTVQGMWD